MYGAVTVSVRRCNGDEYWTKVPEDYTFRDLLSDTVQYFQMPEDGTFLVDRRVSERIDAPNSSIYSRFEDLCSTPQAVILLQLECEPDSAAAAFESTLADDEQDAEATDSVDSAGDEGVVAQERSGQEGQLPVSETTDDHRSSVPGSNKSVRQNSEAVAQPSMAELEG
jgi:hypothetical protein